MKEMLDVYSDEGEHTGSQEKSNTHKIMRDEYFSKGKVTIRHKHALLLLMTSNGRLILQRRSKWKGDNPGLWDKTVGGHITVGDSFDLTMLKECAEELGIPATIVNKEVFEHTAKVTNLHVLGIITKLSFLDNHKSSRVTSDGKKWIHPSMCQFYIGYYDGSIRFIDHESCGIQVFSKEELLDEIEKYPNQFTDDLKYMVTKFKDIIKPIEIKEKVLND